MPERQAVADPWLSNLHVPKASDVLASRLRHRIFSGELAPGMSLPFERDLVATSGLSRTTVREALRILELEGVVQTKPGRNGGTVVRLPPPETVAHSLDVYIRGSRVRLASLLEVREALEPSCAALAATRRTSAELAELDRFGAALEDAFHNINAYLIANVNWHVAIARMSHNELLAGFMEAMSRAIFEGTDIANFNSDKVRREALRAHRRIHEALREQDPGAARRRMARHLRAYEIAVMGFTHPDEVPLG
jgi:GntR family transcriptional repressor for pyruvate dehydrogenase complex